MTPEVWLGLGVLAFTALGFVLRGYVSKPDALRDEISQFKESTTSAISEVRSIVTDHIKKCEAIPTELLMSKLLDFREAFNSHVSDDRAFVSESRLEFKSVQVQWDSLGRTLAVIEERVTKNSTDSEHVRQSLHDLRESMAGIVGRLEVMNKLSPIIPKASLPPHVE